MTWPEMLFFQACKLILLGNISVNSSSRLFFFKKILYFSNFFRSFDILWIFLYSLFEMSLQIFR